MGLPNGWHLIGKPVQHGWHSIAIAQEEKDKQPADGVVVPREIIDGIGRWLSAALSDDHVCAEMKADIHAWMEATR